ncbi:Uncharacterized iron-regulated membrane protein [Amycolatopsis marina]|uniref:Uncharacterized iron-regulated membrane protein n=1 Tax=Amycolatopsis marina TaxID=490629 RepID=A0A1I1B2D1_9PSEU|nr:PepSY domain-containing protein [Amycolatopsis marina]SFB44227.1 Uncharacterized iron-regulated membrane protein [Amycolatopsis marina]
MTTTRTDPSPPSDEGANREPASTASGRAPGGQVRPGTAVWLLARRIHFLAGLLVAPFLAVLALTGLAYACTPQLNDLLYGEQLYVESATGQPRPVAEQISAALAAHPEGEVTSVVLSEEEHRATRVVLEVPGLAGGAGFAAESLTVYVDPYTTTVTGSLVTVGDRPPAQAWLRELHGNLHLGEPGRIYAEFVASWLPFIVLGGLVLWRDRARRARRAGGARAPARSAPDRTRIRARHGVLGLWLTVGLLVLSVTGLTWSTYAGARVDEVIEAVDARAPKLDPPKVLPPAQAAVPMTVDQAVEVSRAEGLTGTVTVRPPVAVDEPFIVAESAEGLPVRKASVAIDPYDARVTARQDWADYPLAAKLTTLGIAAHSGTLFGLANQIVLVLLALGAVVLLVLGYRMWWTRRPRAGGLPAPPGALWRRLPARVAVPLVAAAVLLCWAMPVFGVSLAGFLVVDAVLGALLRRRGASAQRG